MRKNTEDRSEEEIERNEGYKMNKSKKQGNKKEGQKKFGREKEEEDERRDER